MSIRFKAGAYKATPTAHAITKTKGGKNQLAISFRLQEGDDKGKTITFFGGLTGNGVRFSLEALERCGWDKSKEPDFSKPFPYKDVIIVLEDDKYDQDDADNPGQKITVECSRVKYINALDGAFDLQSRAIPAAEAKALAMALAKEFMASGGATTPATSAYTRGPSAEGEGAADDNDIPF